MSIVTIKDKSIALCSQIIEEFLLTQNQLLKIYYEEFPKVSSPSSNYAVIVEPRSEHILLEAVCRNVMYFLPSDWNLVVFSYDEATVRNRLENMEFHFVQTSKPSFNALEYSQLLMSTEFWNAIPGNNILIFQTDSYMTRHVTHEFLHECMKYPFVGAPYRYLLGDNQTDVTTPDKNLNFSICGGFSFRNKQVILDCIREVSFDRIREYRLANNLRIDFECFFHEDFYFNNALYLLNYPIPSFDFCFQFCQQSYYSVVSSFSVHGIYKSYVANNLVFLLRPALCDTYDEIDSKVKAKRSALATIQNSTKEHKKIEYITFFEKGI